MNPKWFISICMFIAITMISIIGYWPRLTEQPQPGKQLKVDKQLEFIEQPEPTEQPKPPERNMILYTTVLDDFTRTIVVQDPLKPSVVPSFLNKRLGDISNPVWAHSHKKILYAAKSDEDLYSFWTVGDQGKQPHQLTNTLPFSAGVSGKWSFDDQYIAFRTSSDRYALSTHSLIVTKIENSNTENESQEIMSDGIWLYDWVPLDHRLAVVRWSSTEASGLYILGVDGSQKDFFPASTFFSRTVPTLINISWSPDGQQIAVTNTPDKLNPITGEQTQVEEVYIIDIKMREARQFTDKQADLIERSLTCLAWSPDGGKITFIAHYTALNGQTRQGALIVVDTKTKTETQLAHYAVTWACPVWSPDGKEIAFISIDNPQNVNGDIYVAEVETNTVRRLTNDTRGKQELSW